MIARPARSGRFQGITKGVIASYMNTSSQMSHNEILRVKLALLQREHRDLDDAIAALDESRRADILTVRRLKKQKLALKDQIARIEDELTPDIIA